MENPGLGPKKTRYCQGHLRGGGAGSGGVLGQSGGWLEDSRDRSGVTARGAPRSPGDPTEAGTRQCNKKGGGRDRARPSSWASVRSGGLAGLPPAGSPGPTPHAVPRPGSGMFLTFVSPLPEARVVAQRAGLDPLEKRFKLSEGPGPCLSSSGGPLDLQQMLSREGRAGRALAFLQPARQNEESARPHLFNPVP